MFAQNRPLFITAGLFFKHVPQARPVVPVFVFDREHNAEHDRKKEQGHLDYHADKHYVIEQRHFVTQDDFAIRFCFIKTESSEAAFIAVFRTARADRYVKILFRGAFPVNDLFAELSGV
ncbi:MAG: hypothetical protein IIZ56_04005 [Clostridia bacterium]|nr:hypothetical protein [Clostridia bacterium]